MILKIRPLATLVLLAFFPFQLYGADTAPNYTVLPGETLSVIALKLYGDGSKWKQLARENHLTEPYLLVAGQNLQLGLSPTESNSSGKKKVVTFWRNVLSRRQGDENDRNVAAEVETSPQTSSPIPSHVEQPEPTIKSEPEILLFSPRKLFSLGTSFFSDRLIQSGISPYNFQGLQIEGSGKAFLEDSNFFAEGSVQYGLVNFSQSLANFNAGLLDGEIRLGYRQNLIEHTFSISPYLDGRYTNMFVTSAAFGYQNIFEGGLGMQISVFLCQYFEILGGASFDFAKQFNFSNRQIDAGLGLQYRFNESDALLLKGSYSHFMASDSPTASTLTLETYKVGLSYVWLFR